MDACLIFAPNVCVNWSASFPFWEVTATALITAAVTGFTIWISVRTARAETTRQLVQDAENRARDSISAEEAAEKYEAAVAKDLRVRLGGSMLRLVHELKLTRGLRDEDAARISALSGWAALRVQVEASGAPSASTLYEYVNLLVERADPSFESGVSVRDRKFRALFVDKARREIDWWVSFAEVSAGVVHELKALREWRSSVGSKHTDEFLDALMTVEPEPPITDLP